MYHETTAIALPGTGRDVPTIRGTFYRGAQADLGSVISAANPAAVPAE